ncbi:MAG: guanylate kinase [Bacteroidia bacterium]|jgi:guanylate kinase
MLRPLFFVFSAPSGAGKTTLVRYVKSFFDGFDFSVSYTSRAPRPHEKDGVDYFFVSEEDFRNKIKTDFFVEWEEVYPGHFYGTPRQPVLNCLRDERSLLLDLDVRGGLAFKKAYPERTVSLFVRVSDLSILEQRLRKRKTESEAKIQMRLEKALLENEQAVFFDAIIPNDHLEEAHQFLNQLMESHGYPVRKS